MEQKKNHVPENRPLHSLPSTKLTPWTY